MPVKNIAHENAKKAFAAIQNVKDNYSVAKKEYLSLVRGADAFIHQCGLLQTFAFYLAKGKTHHHLLIDQLLKHLGCFHGDRLKGYQELLDEKDDMLMLHTAQTRQYLLWLKRYADAMLDEKKQDNGGGEDEGDRDSRQPENPQT